MSCGCIVFVDGRRIEGCSEAVEVGSRNSSACREQKLKYSHCNGTPKTTITAVNQHGELIIREGASCSFRSFQLREFSGAVVDFDTRAKDFANDKTFPATLPSWAFVSQKKTDNNGTNL